MNNELVIDNIFKSIKSKIKKQWVVAFLACFIIGVLSYGYLMANNFLTYDSMWNLYSDQDMITSGRQFLTYACGISSYYNLPYLNGLLAIFYLSVTTIFLTEIFDIKSNLSIISVAGLVVTFPSVISTFCYIYTVDGYMLGVLLTTIAFWCTLKKPWGFVPGMVLLGISLGIYQANLSFAMIFCVLTLLLDLIEKIEYKKFFFKVARFLAMGAGGYLFYIVSLNLMLKWKGQELSGYQGVDKLEGFLISSIPEGIKSAYKSFVDFARWGNVLTTTNVMKFMVIFLVLAGVGLYLYLFISRGGYKKIWNSILIFLLVISIPLCTNIINVLSPDTYYHLIMRGAWSLLFVFVIALMEKIVIDKKSVKSIIKKFVCLGVVLASLILVFEFSKMANVVGFKMNERYEKSYAFAVKIVERLEEIPEYKHGMKVAILGGKLDQEIFPSTDITTTDLVGYIGTEGEFCYHCTSYFATFVSHYLNVTIDTVSNEEEIQLTQTEEYMDMERFPSKESIKQIGDVWVIKLNG